METALRDWLFGCNPWGVSMIIGLPDSGTYSHDPHSSLSHLYKYQLSGGLLDGPVYQSIYGRQKYVHLTEEDEFSQFQSELAVYHDDVGDYVTNEPTMDGTASLVYYLAAMQNQSHRLNKVSENTNFSTYQGAITRGDSTRKNIALVFTGDEYADGAAAILSVLEKYHIKASFFLTGNFYRNKKFLNIIERLNQNGHYLGAHSDKHLLYCDWDDRLKLKLTKSQFLHDLHKNYMEMHKFGIDKQEALYYLPPFEWYNQTISTWTSECGLQLINYTPGTLSHADYTTPSMGKTYITSDKIMESIFQYEEIYPAGLSGFILLMHTGMGEERSDKLYNKLDSMIHQLSNLGYSFVRIDQLLKTTG